MTIFGAISGLNSGAQDFRISIGRSGFGNKISKHELTEFDALIGGTSKNIDAGTNKASVLNVIREALLSSRFDAESDKNLRFSIEGDAETGQDRTDRTNRTDRQERGESDRSDRSDGSDPASPRQGIGWTFPAEPLPLPAVYRQVTRIGTRERADRRMFAREAAQAFVSFSEEHPM